MNRTRRSSSQLVAALGGNPHAFATKDETNQVDREHRTLVALDLTMRRARHEEEEEERGGMRFDMPYQQRLFLGVAASQSAPRFQSFDIPTVMFGFKEQQRFDMIVYDRPFIVLAAGLTSMNDAAQAAERMYNVVLDQKAADQRRRMGACWVARPNGALSVTEEDTTAHGMFGEPDIGEASCAALRKILLSTHIHQVRDRYVD